jgi:hypothetical protein
MKYYLETPNGDRQPCNEWEYLEAMASKCYEHVIATDSVIIYRRWRCPPK